MDKTSISYYFCVKQLAKVCRSFTCNFWQMSICMWLMKTLWRGYETLNHLSVSYGGVRKWGIPWYWNTCNVGWNHDIVTAKTTKLVYILTVGTRYSGVTLTHSAVSVLWGVWIWHLVKVDQVDTFQWSMWKRSWVVSRSYWMEIKHANWFQWGFTGMLPQKI